ncbi:MAG: transposase [Armatimonadetes bacterium]|nr:transposase [Armatimonadota bacterium]
MSVGEWVDLLAATAVRGAATVAALREACREAPYVHMDETGWREAGKNGWLWSCCTPSVRYYEYHPGRGSDVAKRLLGEEYTGVLVSDFLSAYHWQLGEHQRCWVHLLRDVREVMAAHPHHRVVQRWAQRVHRLYQRAKNWHPKTQRGRNNAAEACPESFRGLSAGRAPTGGAVSGSGRTAAAAGQEVVRFRDGAVRLHRTPRGSQRQQCGGARYPTGGGRSQGERRHPVRQRQSDEDSAAQSL